MRNVFQIIPFVLVFLVASSPVKGEIKLGIDVLIEESGCQLLKGKKVGLITNHSAVNKNLETTFALLKAHQDSYTLACVFAPEHGFYGNAYAYEEVEDQSIEGIPLYTLFGSRRRPTQDQLATVDILVFDLQDIGTRSYTFISTLFYCMEEAARTSIPLIVLDRPNPMGGLIVDGPLIEEKWRSFLGYANVPYCHGMTVGELARFFNEEYRVGCQLTVVPMKGWKRKYSFQETGLPWVPTSPQIPECDTPFFYPATGLLGHCSIVNTGVGYTLPFKLVGAPWIKAEQFAEALNQQNLPGVFFQPFYFRPFFGKFKSEECQGVRLVITDSSQYLPVTTQFTIMGVLKNLYPKKFEAALIEVKKNGNKRDVFHKLCGSEQILETISSDKYIIWKLREICAQARAQFLPVRAKYLMPNYN
jgi:uncharacterized protein YbbC (DUF1343 family)